MVEFIAIIFRVVAMFAAKVDIDDAIDAAPLGERHRLGDDSSVL